MLGLSLAWPVIDGDGLLDGLSGRQRQRSGADSQCRDENRRSDLHGRILFVARDNDYPRVQFRHRRKKGAALGHTASKGRNCMTLDRMLNGRPRPECCVDAARFATVPGEEHYS